MYSQDANMGFFEKSIKTSVKHVQVKKKSNKEENAKDFEKNLENLRIVSRLSCTIILQTAKDLSFDDKNTNIFSESSRRDRRRKMEAKKEAMDWLMDRQGDHFFSITNCCTYINNYLVSLGRNLPLINPEFLRNKIINSPEDIINISHSLCFSSFASEDSISVDMPNCKPPKSSKFFN